MTNEHTRHDTNKSEAAEALLFQLRAVGIDAPESEYRFHPNRKWRFDFAYLADRVAIEIDGGNYMARMTKRGPVAVGRHTKGDDYEKLNEAVIFGWRVLRFTPEQVKNGYALNTIERALGLVQVADDEIPF